MTPTRRLVAPVLAASVLAGAAGASEPSAVRALLALDQARKALDRHQQSAGTLPRDPSELYPVLLAYAPVVALRDGHPVDPWGHAFVYRPPTAAGAPYTLYSIGENGRDDGGAGDDLTTRERADAAIYPELLERPRQALGLFQLLMVFLSVPVLWGTLRFLRRNAMES